jgi:hypothetical protein
MADVIYNGFLQYKNDGTIDLKNDTIKVALFTSSYNPDRDAHDNWVDLSNECSGEGYSGGIELQNKVVSHQDTGDLGKFTADAAAFGTLTVSDIKWAVLYKDAAAAADRKLIMAKDLSGPFSPVGVPFSVTWHADGILTEQQTA